MTESHPGPSAGSTGLGIDAAHYVPVLKAREGEYAALREVAVDVKSSLTPLLEVPSVPYDFVNEEPAKTLEQHLQNVAAKLLGAWGVARPIMLDLLWIPSALRMANSEHPWEFLSRDALTKGVHLIPVTGLQRDASYQTATAGVATAHERGVAIRLELEDFASPRSLGSALVYLLAALSARPETTDLVLDLKEVRADQLTAMTLLVPTLLANLPSVLSWRSLCVVATGFPSDLTQFPSASDNKTPRTEWILWNALRNRLSDLPRLPTFGDYGISHPVSNEVDPRLMRMSANLRYTLEEQWLIFKGRNVRDHGYDQFRGHCRALVQRSEFSGAAFSWGDSYIHRCAAGTDGPGNATTWRKVGTSHHLAFVTRQIASLPST
jgi:hypothetical protein